MPPPRRQSDAENEDHAVRAAGFAIATVLGAAAAFVVPAALPPGSGVSPPDAAAVAPGQVVGIYKVRLVGDGWQSVNGVPSSQRLRADAYITIARADGQGGNLLHATITVGNGAASLLPSGKAFDATASLSGDALGLVSTGAPAGVSAANLRFELGGKRVSGTWLLVIPAGTPEAEMAGTAGGFSLVVKGKQTRSFSRPAR
jgi:hypothetical protein